MDPWQTFAGGSTEPSDDARVPGWPPADGDISSKDVVRLASTPVGSSLACSGATRTVCTYGAAARSSSPASRHTPHAACPNGGISRRSRRPSNRPEGDVCNMIQVMGTSCARHRSNKRPFGVQALTQQICTAFPDPTSAEDLLGKLLQHKDNHIFRGLATLAAGGILQYLTIPPCLRVARELIGASIHITLAAARSVACARRLQPRHCRSCCKRCSAETGSSRRPA